MSALYIFDNMTSSWYRLSSMYNCFLIKFSLRKNRLSKIVLIFKTSHSESIYWLKLYRIFQQKNTGYYIRGVAYLRKDKVDVLVKKGFWTIANGRFKSIYQLSHSIKQKRQLVNILCILFIYQINYINTWEMVIITMRLC